MSYCRFCGNELYNGSCSCSEYQEAHANASQYYYKCKDPLVVPVFNTDFTSVSGAMSSIRDQSGMSDADSSKGDPYERNVPIVPDCIRQEENEIVVKQYNLARLRTRLKFMKAEGRLMVTNRRVIFRASGSSLTGNLLQEHQFNLDEIAGIEMHKDYKFNLLNMIGCLLLEFVGLTLSAAIFSRVPNGYAIAIGLILGFVGFMPMFLLYKRFGKKYLGAVMGSCFFGLAYASTENGNRFLLFLFLLSLLLVLVNMVILCFVPNLHMKIKTKGGTGALVIGSQKGIIARIIGDDYTGFREVIPWDDAIMAMNELGSMIDDLQKHGDYAVEKWTSTDK